MGYNPDEARDEKGKWTSGGGGVGGAVPAKGAGGVGRWAANKSAGSKMTRADRNPAQLSFKLPKGLDISQAAMHGLASTVQAGKLAPGMSAIAHALQTKQLIDAHAKGLGEMMSKLKGAAPEGADVSGRTKEIESMTGKLAKGDSWLPHAGKGTDLTGTRVIMKNIAEVKAMEAKVRELFPNVLEHNDYISNPKQDSGYRSSHMIIQDKDGLTKEIQLRTQNQHTHANFLHDAVYKPHTPEQRQLMQTHGEHVKAYAVAMGNYFAKKDAGVDPGPKPVPHPEVRRVLGEMPG